MALAQSPYWDVDDIAKRIAKNRGNIAVTAKQLRVSRMTLYRYMEKHPECRDARDEARESVLDDIESVLIKRALAGNTAELIFFLKTQGKSRGYTERQEFEHSGMVTTKVIEGPKDVR